MYCTNCGTKLSDETQFCSKCGTEVASGAAQNTGSVYPRGSMYCTTCGKVGKPRGMSKWELIFVLLISVFTLFIPLMIYLMVRSGKRCRNCGKKSLVPLDSPVAQGGIRGQLASTTQKPPVAPQLKTARKKAWVDRHPIWTFLIALWAIGMLGQFALEKSGHAIRLEPPSTQAEVSSGSTVAVPAFHLFKFKSDAPITFVVPKTTTDEQLKSLLWLFRQKVRSGRFGEIGISKPTAKQWNELGYKSGMLLVYKGEKCANETYVDPSGHDVGPCGYGEHDDAYYQWGIDADPNKDSAGIRDKNGDQNLIFDYKDNWQPPATGK